MDGYPWSLGNTASCDFLGFLMRFALAVAFMNAALSLYFMLKITRNRTDQSFSKFETPVYMTSLLVPLTFGGVGVATESFNTSEAYHICAYGDYPPLCSDSLDVECERGDTYRLQDYIFTGALLILTITSIVGVIRLYVHVRTQLRSSRARAFHTTFDETAKKRSRAVLVQSTLYTFAYLNGLLWSMLERIVTDALGETNASGKPGIYTLQVLSYLMFPAQGFFNFVIFIRPLYLQRRNDCPAESRVETMAYVLHGEKTPRLVASSGHTKRTNATSNNSTDKSDMSNGLSSDRINNDCSYDGLDSVQRLESIDEASFEMQSEPSLRPDEECSPPSSLSD